MLLTNPNKFPSWKAIFYDKLQVFLALWYPACKWSSSFFLHVFYSPGCFSSKGCLHHSLVLATPAETCSRSLGLSETTDRIHLAWQMVVKTLGIAQTSVFTLSGHRGTLLRMWDIMYLAAGRMDSLSLKCLLSPDQDQRVKAKTMTSLPLTQLSERRSVKLNYLKQESDKILVSASAPCPDLTQFL